MDTKNPEPPRPFGLPLSNRIAQFTGPYAFLGNFWPAVMYYGGFRCATSEHAFQLAKARSWSEKATVAAQATPKEAKRAGRLVELRPDWERVKLIVMHEIVTIKFVSYPDLTKLLLDTQDCELVEGNTWNDTFWGVSLATGKGTNHLGHILMSVRDHLVRKLWPVIWNHLKS